MDKNKFPEAPSKTRARIGNIRQCNPEQYKKALADGAVYVGRPTKWGNQFKLADESQRFAAIRDYTRWAFATKQLGWRNEVRQELAGKDLICWCAPDWCHADILAGIASTPAE